jgi:hexosaminidase
MIKTIWTIVFLFVGQFVIQAQPSVIPQPLSIHLTSDQLLSVNSVLYIVYDSKLVAEANLLSQNIKKVTGIDVKFSHNPPKTSSINTIYLKLDKNTSSDVESYQLQINNKGVVITASDAAGIFYGGVTLQQLLNRPTKDKQQWQLPFVEIHDKPRFGWRGLMLDCSRTFIALEYLKKTIDRMAFYKMNTLQLHLTDDQGWRLEITKYSLLTKQGAYFDKKYNEPKEFQGFYTQQQIKDLVVYAQSRHVQIVPEIESPGHSSAALNVYPQFSCTGKIVPIHPLLDPVGLINDVFCAGNPDSYKLLNEVIKEEAALFPSPYLHLGGDEVRKDPWKECPKCQAVMSKLHIKDEEKLQSYFMSKLGNEVLQYKKRPVAWGEILDGEGISKDWVIMVWRQQQTSIKATKDGYDVVMSPFSHLYFDYDYSTTNTKKVYSYQPVPADATAEEKRHYLGIQANFWSHIDRTESRIDYQLFPRLLALAERAWSDEAVNDYNNFAIRKSNHTFWLNLFDIKYNQDAE